MTLYYLKTEPVSRLGDDASGALAAANNNTQTGVNFVWSHNLTRSAVLNFNGFLQRTTANSPFTGYTNQGGARLDFQVPLSPQDDVHHRRALPVPGFRRFARLYRIRHLAGLNYLFR